MHLQTINGSGDMLGEASDDGRSEMKTGDDGDLQLTNKQWSEWGAVDIRTRIK
jgi:hypothetical protein